VPTESGEVLVLAILTAGAATIALVAVLVAYLAQAGRRRAGLAPAAVTLSLVGPVCGIAAASKHLTQTFADMANSGSGGAAALIAGCARAQNLMRLGDGIAMVTLVLAAGLGWLDTGSPSTSDRPQPPARRLIAALALSMLAVIVAGGLHEYVGATNRIAVAVAEGPAAEPGEPGEGPVVVEALVSRMTRGMLLGGLGAPVLLLIIAGLAVTCAILGWNADAPPSFRIAGTALLLMTAALAVAGALLFDRPVLIPR
jgi:hypothetical protein